MFKVVFLQHITNQVLSFMRKFIFPLICVVFSCKTSKRSAESTIQHPLDHVRVSIHRGGGFETLWPENAQESFQHYLKEMPGSMLECDVRMTKDSVLVLMHDDDLNRTSNGQGLISTSMYKDLMSLRLKDNFGNLTAFHIPRLDSVLVWADGKVAFTLDVKRFVPYDFVVKHVKQYHSLENCVLTTYTMDEVKTMGQLSPEVKVSCGIFKEGDLQEIRGYGLTDKQIFAFLGTHYPDKALIQFLHVNHIPVIQATIGSLDKQGKENGGLLYKDLDQIGVDIFATDYPYEVYSALGH